MLGQFFCPLFRVTGTPVHLSENLFGFVGTLWGPLWEVVWKLRGLPWKLVWNVGCRNSLKCHLLHLLHVSSRYLPSTELCKVSQQFTLTCIHESKVMSHIVVSNLLFTCDMWHLTALGWREREDICPVLQCVALCCSVLQCVAVCCSVLQCVAVFCSVLQYVAVFCSVLQCVAERRRALQCVAVCCSKTNAKKNLHSIKRALSLSKEPYIVPNFFQSKER